MTNEMILLIFCVANFMFILYIYNGLIKTLNREKIYIETFRKQLHLIMQVFYYVKENAFDLNADLEEIERQVKENEKNFYKDLN